MAGKRKLTALEREKEKCRLLRRCNKFLGKDIDLQRRLRADAETKVGTYRICLQELLKWLSETTSPNPSWGITKIGKLL